APCRSSAPRESGTCCRSTRSTTKCLRRRCRPTENCSSAHEARCMRSPSNALVAVALAAVLGIALSAHTTTALAVAQQKPIDVRDKKEFRSGSELVTTAVTVRDQEGRLITDLEAKDFTVEEDGVAQPITQFTTER